MNNSPTSPPPDDDDAAWLSALAGTSATHGTQAGHKEGSELRRILLSLMDERLRRAGAELDGNKTWMRLSEHARREGLIDEPAPAASFAAPVSGAPLSRRRGVRGLAGWINGQIRPRTAWGGVAALAALLLLIVGVAPNRYPPEPAADTLRGGGGLAVLRDANPAGAARTLKGELLRAGARVYDYQRPGGAGLDIDWPSDRDQFVRTALATHHVVPPAGAFSVRIEISSD